MVLRAVAIGVFLVVIAGGLAVLLAAVAAGAAYGRRSALAPGAASPPLDDAPAAYRRALTRARTVGRASWAALLVVAVALLMGLTRLPQPGIALAVTPAAAGIVFLAVGAAGELRWPHPVGAVRRAPLVVRTVRMLAPTGLRRLTWGWATLIAVTLVATGVTADTTGRGLLVSHGDLGQSGASPYPGWYYGVPLLIGTLVVLAGCEVVLRLIALRPAVADTAPDDDHRLRRTCARRVLAGTQLVLAVTAAGVLAVTAAATHNLSTYTVGMAADGSVAATWYEHVSTGAVVASVVTAALAAATLVSGVVVAVVNLSRAAGEAARPRLAPATATGSAGAPS